MPQQPLHTYLKMSNDELARITCFLNGDGEERFFCPNCRNVKYTKVRYLKTHIKQCGQTFYCAKCGVNYKQKRSYDVHMRSKHIDVW